MSLTGKSPAETYKDITYVDNSNNGVTSTLKAIKTGEGSSSSLSVSDRSLKVKSATDNTVAFDVQNASGSSKLLVDTTNNYVKANGVHVHTNYAYFGLDNGYGTNFSAGYHYAMSFGNTGFATTAYISPFNFGNGTDPATSSAMNNNAYDMIHFMWYLPDSISIDSVTSLEGADAATGDTTRFHLMSYDFTSGSTDGLTNGTLLAHSSDTTNAGYEQIYKGTLTIDSASVSSGKVIVATFESDSVNSDYTSQIIVKYHITG